MLDITRSAVFPRPPKTVCIFPKMSIRSKYTEKTNWKGKFREMMNAFMHLFHVLFAFVRKML